MAIQWTTDMTLATAARKTTGIQIPTDDAGPAGDPQSPGRWRQRFDFRTRIMTRVCLILLTLVLQGGFGCSDGTPLSTRQLARATLDLSARFEVERVFAATRVGSTLWVSCRVANGDCAIVMIDHLGGEHTIQLIPSTSWCMALPDAGAVIAKRHDDVVTLLPMDTDERRPVVMDVNVRGRPKARLVPNSTVAVMEAMSIRIDDRRVRLVTLDVASGKTIDSDRLERDPATYRMATDGSRVLVFPDSPQGDEVPVEVGVDGEIRKQATASCELCTMMLGYSRRHGYVFGNDSEFGIETDSLWFEDTFIDLPRTYNMIRPRIVTDEYFVYEAEGGRFVFLRLASGEHWTLQLQNEKLAQFYENDGTVTIVFDGKLLQVDLQGNEPVLIPLPDT